MIACVATRRQHDEPAAGLREAAAVLDYAAMRLAQTATWLREKADQTGEPGPADFEVWVGTLAPVVRLVSGVLDLIAGEAGRQHGNWRDLARAVGEPKSTVWERWRRPELKLSRETVQDVAARARGRWYTD